MNRSIRTSAPAFLLALPILLTACGAVFPELSTRTRHAVPDQPLEPLPPTDLQWMHFVSGTVPPHTRDGRPWKDNGKADPLAKLLVNGKEALTTDPETDTREPTWPKSPGGNFRFRPGDKLRIELWNSGAVSDTPICVHEIGKPSEQALLEKQIRIECDNGGSVVMAFEPAHAVMGLGLSYDLRSPGSTVTKVLEDSPAQREGIRPGDDILKIAGHDASAMTPEEIQSAFNGVPHEGIEVVVKHKGGSALTLTLKEGPIYAEFFQFGPVP